MTKRFYTNKTKPKCNTYIKYYAGYDALETVYLVSERKKELDLGEVQWSEIKDDVIIWQEEETFDSLFKKRLGIKE